MDTNNEQLLLIKKKGNRDVKIYNELLQFFTRTLSRTMNCE